MDTGDRRPPGRRGPSRCRPATAGRTAWTWVGSARGYGGHVGKGWGGRRGGAGHRKSFRKSRSRRGTCREVQEVELGLVLNAAVLWTTRYLDAAADQLRALPAGQREHDVLDEDVTRLSPLRHANLNVLGRYGFRPSVPAGGNLRPLRDPAEAADDEDTDE
ncbi:Tn3 family transposase [Streptomyces sp. NBC_01235]|uniref:Tn3 family transposase n=1 Tax=Streptomyces sp. NBC_01235 TaxID=2903788 RepID=UPI002E1136FC|nr:transposase [Streptomyces sp. NBC_01235]